MAACPAASFDERVEALFRPPLAEMITLSPDGQRVAYTTRAGRDLTIAIMNLEQGGSKRLVAVDSENDTSAGAERPPTQLRFFRWSTPTRLVFAPTERVVPLPAITDKKGRTIPNPDGPKIMSPVIAVDADGKQRGTVIDASNFQETPDDARKTLADLLRTTKELVATSTEPVRWRMPHLDIVGFVPREPDQLIVRTLGAYSPPAQYLVDIRTADVRSFDGNWPSPPGEPHVFDGYGLKVVGERKIAAHPTTLWRDAELAGIQRELEVKFPRRVVEILDWTDTRARVLFRVTGGSDPGRLFVFQRPENLPLEILRRAPWLSAAQLNETRFFEFDAPDGARLSGYITWPKKSRVDPPPLLVTFPSGFPGHAQPAWDAEAQVFADLGFAVARLNHRAVAGVRPMDVAAVRSGVDRISVGDALTTIDWLAGHFPDRPFDRKRVATLGRGFGGYLAVRALQLHPAHFRCGIAFDAPMELRPWLRASTATPASQTKSAQDIPGALIDHDGTDWKKLSVLEADDALLHPVLLLVEPARSSVVDASTAELRKRLQRRGRVAECLDLEPAFAAAVPQARAAVYRKIEDFFNLHLHEFAVKVGSTQEVK